MNPETMDPLGAASCERCLTVHGADCGADFECLECAEMYCRLCAEEHAREAHPKVYEPELRALFLAEDRSRRLLAVILNGLVAVLLVQIVLEPRALLVAGIFVAAILANLVLIPRAARLACRTRFGRRWLGGWRAA